MSRKQKRSYVYRVPLDDGRAVRKINRLDALDSGYFIHEVKDKNIPNKNQPKHWGYIFYRSKEMRDLETDSITGGTIPGLSEYRYSIDWEPVPEYSLIEMTYSNDGGIKLRGEYRVGFSDPRLSDWVPIDMRVNWTPGEIKAMYDGEPVPNKIDYHHDPPMMEASEAREKFRELVREHALHEGTDKVKQDLQEYIEDCDHHIIESEDDWLPSYCEDCGKEWRDNEELQAEVESSEAMIVGAA